MVAEVHHKVVPLLGGVAIVLRGDRPPRLLLGYLVLSRERSEAGGSTKKNKESIICIDVVRMSGFIW